MQGRQKKNTAQVLSLETRKKLALHSSYVCVPLLVVVSLWSGRSSQRKTSLEWGYSCCICHYNTVCPTWLQWNLTQKTRKAGLPRNFLLRTRMSILVSFLVRDEKEDCILGSVIQKYPRLNCIIRLYHRWTFLFGFAAVWRNCQCQCMAW